MEVKTEGKTAAEGDNSDKATPSVKEEAKPEETKPKNRYDSLRYCVVTNDGNPDSLVKLVGLKSLFAKQLPKMPRPYIARLVFDRRHKSLAILNNDPQTHGGDEEIVGAICYRAFAEMRFAEIAFCAVNSSHQVKVRAFFGCVFVQCANYLMSHVLIAFVCVCFASDSSGVRNQIDESPQAARGDGGNRVLHHIRGQLRHWLFQEAGIYQGANDLCARQCRQTAFG